MSSTKSKIKLIKKLLWNGKIVKGSASYAILRGFAMDYGIIRNHNNQFKFDSKKCKSFN